MAFNCHGRYILKTSEKHGHYAEVDVDIVVVFTEHDSPISVRYVDPIAEGFSDQVKHLIDIGVENALAIWSEVASISILQLEVGNLELQAHATHSSGGDISATASMAVLDALFQAAVESNMLSLAEANAYKEKLSVKVDVEGGASVVY